MANRIGYGLGDVANTLSFGMTSMFLLAYYTDVLGISAAAAGTLFLVARIWDAVNDPMMGAFCDKLFQKHNGVGDKFRPFLLRGSWLLLVSGILVFWAPESLTATQKLVWAYVTYIIWGMCYTFINIPYGSLATVMTQDPGERASLSGARAMGGVSGSIACNILVPFMLSIFADDLSKAYLYSMIILGALSVVCYLLAYRFTQEHIKHEASSCDTKFSLKDTLNTLGRNKPFLCVSISSLFLLTAMMGQGAVFYYYLSLSLDGALWMISLTAVLQVVTVVIVGSSIGKVAEKFGVKKIMTTSFLIAGIFALITFLLPTSIYSTLFFYVLGMPFVMIPNVLIWANVADCIDHNYEISGQRQEGIIYSSYSFMRKMGQAIAGFIAGMGLSLVGYDAALEIQSSFTLSGIKGIMFLMPAIAMFICFFLYQFMWTLDSRTKENNQTTPEPVAS
ncbi:MFS transporter [Endozoicomonas lisbonensis]